MKNRNVALFLLSLVPTIALAQNAAPAGNAAAGKTLWEGPRTECEACHGEKGEGGFGPDLAGRGLSVGQFTQAVRKPWGIMPTFTTDQVSDADLANLTAYFASLPKVATPGEWKYKVSDDMPQGQKVFHEVGCAQCHLPIFYRGRGTLGGLNASFDVFKDIVYDHTGKMREYDEQLGLKGAKAPPPPPPPPPGSPPRERNPLRMGNFLPTRVSEDQLKEMYDWIRNDIGYRPNLSARLTASGPTYTLNLANAGLQSKGVTAQGLTVDLAIPAGATVVSTTGVGYKGTHKADAFNLVDVYGNTRATKNNVDVAEWQIPRMAPQDTVTLTITLSKPGTREDNVEGLIRWATPKPKKGTDLPMAINAPAAGGRGG